MKPSLQVKTNEGVPPLTLKSLEKPRVGCWCTCWFRISELTDEIFLVAVEDEDAALLFLGLPLLFTIVLIGFLETEFVDDTTFLPSELLLGLPIMFDGKVDDSSDKDDSASLS